MGNEVIEDGEGGESACYAHLLCRECGAVLEGTNHQCGEHAGELVVDARRGPER